jgi:hypothetical protein
MVIFRAENLVTRPKETARWFHPEMAEINYSKEPEGESEERK